MKEEAEKNTILRLTCFCQFMSQHYIYFNEGVLHFMSAYDN